MTAIFQIAAFAIATPVTGWFGFQYLRIAFKGEGR